MKSFKNDYLKDNLLREYSQGLVTQERNDRVSAMNSLQEILSQKLNQTEKGTHDGLATLDSNGVLSESQWPPSQNTGNVFIFRPGETQNSSNIFGTWVSLGIAIAQTKGLKYIQFDDSLQSINIPVDNFDFSDCILLPKKRKNPYLNVNFASGFLIGALPLEVIGLNLQFSSHFFDQAGNNTLSLTDSSLDYNSDTSDGIEFYSNSLTLNLKNSQITSNSRPVFNLNNRVLNVIGISGFCNVGQDTIKGDSFATLSVINKGSAFFGNGSIVQQQSLFQGIRSDLDYLHSLEKTLLYKGELISRNSAGDLSAIPPGQNGEVIIYDSNSDCGLRSVALPPSIAAPGMKTVVDFIRQSSPSTPLLTAGNRTLDCSTSNLFRITGGNATLTLSNLVENQIVNVIVESTGSSYTISWSGGTFLWPNASVPVPALAPSRKDFYTFIKVGSLIFGSCVLNMG
ncbi:hypothetical protein LFX25_20425 [Leptospira sp. FAT2]|uniref:hypothetical protein n=1 Tax=Leptospira sanjuanensis TaxID=2879643 RepID=UPI001EE86C7D|nr:hypothetical protein [Leptospira sanjuanensis]MCG6195612.1 hypothetical protein [Leptospira sanjuanensis]